MTKKISQELVAAARKWAEAAWCKGHTEYTTEPNPITIEHEKQAKQEFIELAQSIEKHIDLAEALAIKNAECADYWKEQHKLI